MSPSSGTQHADKDTGHAIADLSETSNSPAIRTPSDSRNGSVDEEAQRDEGEDEDERYSEIGGRRSGAEMASWSGQPAIKGGSEMMRMVLLTFNAIGITYVHHCAGMDQAPC